MSQTPRPKTLLQWFKPTPKKIEEKAGIVGSEERPQKRQPEECATPKSQTKRRRVVLSSDDEDEEMENITPPESKTPKTPKTPKSSLRKDNQTPKSTPTSRCPGTPVTPMVSGELAESFIAAFRKNEDMEDTDCGDDVEVKEKRGSGGDDDEEVRFLHLDLDFLQPGKIRDAKGRRPSDPDYDARTLHVPDDFMTKQSPGHKQWWKIKSQHFDTVLFFKVGKFYELYHMDAAVAVECCSLTYMRGAFAHAGFPEVSYGRFADQMLSRGYKVARVEQTETPQQLEERQKRERVKDKVVRREVCQVTTNATRTYGVLDGNDTNTLESAETSAQYLFAICESASSDVSVRYGVCFVDASVGKFYVAEFEDDVCRSSLYTLVANYTPAQILIKRGGVSYSTKSMFTAFLTGVPIDELADKTEFLKAEQTLKMLREKNYLGEDVSTWPELLRSYLDEEGKPKEDAFLALSALGAVLWYLRRCLIDVDMVTMKVFEDAMEKMKAASFSGGWKDRSMVLDGVALYNLNVLPLGDLTAARTSLFTTMNHCVTPMGCRLLRNWLCSPTCDAKQLKARQEAVRWLKESAGGDRFANDVLTILSAIPDLEKLVQKTHTMGLKYRATEHPDSRAQMFEAEKYGVRKVRDFVATLDGFKKIQDLAKLFYELKDEEESCGLLDVLLSSNTINEMVQELEYFDNAFDHEKALASGEIVPERGMNADYDEALRDVFRAEEVLVEYLEEVRREYKCSTISYFGTGKNRYQLEIPDSKPVGKGFEIKGRKKGFIRYRTPKLNSLVEALDAAEAERDRQGADAMRKVFADFDSKAEMWTSVMWRAATVDVLVSLATYASSSSLEMCLPDFDFDTQKPFVNVINGVHPVMAVTQQKKTSWNSDDAPSVFIPNDTNLGGESPLTIVLTGPNMGGKSTLMRQVALLTLMAHLGSYVPARSMRLSPVDRIFTRIGANDKILAGQSTFFVEMTETRVIMNNATKHSLVLIDELGRGTSTYDGTAIATAVLKKISPLCRCIFSTHYHSLCEDLTSDVNLSHMACMVEKEVDDLSEEQVTMECVTFLYKLAPGVCPKSHGFFAAKLAGVPDKVIRRAQLAAKKMTKGRLDQLRELAKEGNVAELEKLVQLL